MRDLVLFTMSIPFTALLAVTLVLVSKAVYKGTLNICFCVVSEALIYKRSSRCQEQTVTE